MSLGSYLPAPGIRFNDCVFTEPTRLDGWTPPLCAGLFGIFVADPNWAPKPFQPLYFGEFGNNAPASRLLGECRSLIAVSRGKTLLVSVLPLPFSTTSQRCALRSELISAYNPLCQAGGSSTSPMDLAHKLDEIEKRHQEQTAQVMLLLASVNRIFGPLPEPPPRRGIGFLPPSEPANESAPPR
ncbi:MAG TPA: hypothetical protein VGZ73_02065 [Bryobacteraceae bacterium]|jgi:hypothetical protein|nr:hypothetical protein [Bryobacteraceae bacterium]